MLPIHSPLTPEPRDRPLLTLGIVLVVLLVALVAMPFITHARAESRRSGTSHSSGSAV